MTEGAQQLFFIAVGSASTKPGMTYNLTCDEIVREFREYSRELGNLFEPEIKFRIEHIDNEKGMRYKYAISTENHRTYATEEEKILRMVVVIFLHIVKRACYGKNLRGLRGKFEEDLRLIESLRSKPFVKDERRYLRNLIARTCMHLVRLEMKATVLPGQFAEDIVKDTNPQSTEDSLFPGEDIPAIHPPSRSLVQGKDHGGHVREINNAGEPSDEEISQPGERQFPGTAPKNSVDPVGSAHDESTRGVAETPDSGALKQFHLLGPTEIDFLPLSVDLRKKGKCTIENCRKKVDVLLEQRIKMDVAKVLYQIFGKKMRVRQVFYNGKIEYITSYYHDLV